MGIENIDIPPTPEARRHYITEEEFLKVPQTLERYSFPENITRENFLSFLAMSYAISQGVPPAQRLFFMLIEQETKQDVWRTLRNFQLAIGWDGLTEGEKQIFLTKMEQVSAHEKINPEDRIAAIKKDFAKNLIYHPQDMVNAIDFKLRDVRTIDAFNRTVSPLIKREKAKPRKPKGGFPKLPF